MEAHHLSLNFHDYEAIHLIRQYFRRFLLNITALPFKDWHLRYLI